MLYFSSEENKMLQEALEEMIFLSAQGIMYRKNSSWTISQEGCLGYPSAIILLSIVDSIGKYFVGKDLKINIDGNVVTINDERPIYKRFYILNSIYYGQNFSDNEIKLIYSKYRNALVHSATVDPGNFIDIGDKSNKAFEIKEINGQSIPFINLVPFWHLNKKAVEKLLGDLNEKNIEKFSNFAISYINF